MIKTIKMYSIVCDRCGRTLGDGVVWEDKSAAISYALNSIWKEIGDKHYCKDCYEFDEDLDKYVPKMIYRNDVLGNHLVKELKFYAEIVNLILPIYGELVTSKVRQQINDFHML